MFSFFFNVLPGIKYGFMRFANHCILFLFMFYTESQLFRSWGCVFRRICARMIQRWRIKSRAFSCGCIKPGLHSSQSLVSTSSVTSVWAARVWSCALIRRKPTTSTAPTGNESPVLIQTDEIFTVMFWRISRAHKMVFGTALGVVGWYYWSSSDALTATLTLL